jgi:hypothetical protein
VDNQVIVNNFVNPADLAATLVPPDVVNPPSWQPSFPVKPGQTVWVTLRIRGVMDANLAGRAGLWVRSQPDTVADNTLDEAKDGVIDLAAPGFSTTPGQVLGTGEATGPLGGVVNYTLPKATDTVDAAPVVACAPVSGSSFPLGDSTVTCTATDASLNSTSAAFKVVVVDTTPPTFPTAGSALAGPTQATGPSGATVSYALPAAIDVVDTAPTVSCSLASGSTFSIGTTSVTCTATDRFGNSASATFTVTVVDTTPPVVVAPPNVTAEATGTQTSVAIGTATATDAVGVVSLVSNAPTTFPVGSTTVTWTARDAAGNVGTATQAVTVVDTIAPVVGPHANVTAEATSASGAVVSYALPTVADSVGVASLTCAPASGSIFPIGTTTVTCTAKDAVGNASVTTFTVTVRDTTAPAVGPHANVTAEATSALGAVVDYTLPTATDSVGVASLTCTPASGSIFPIGTTTVACTATDAAGNTSAPSTFTVTVADTTPPLIVETATPNVLIWSPNKVMTPVTVEGTITDATTITATYRVVDEYGTYTSRSDVPLTVANGTYSFTVFLEAWRNGSDADGRTYTITVTAKDSKGNTATKSVIVKVPHNT